MYGIIKLTFNEGIMSKKIADYLEDHLSGEVSTAKDVRRYFQTDGSVFQLEPSVVVYPRNTSDVRKVVRFSYQLASKGKVVPVTARGRGTDQAGAALGSGIMLVFPAHMKHLLELDTGKKTAVIQPGINYQTFQHALHTHGLFMPPYPSSIDYATLGGAVANNTAGEKTLKYGATRNFVEGLDVVLSNGELIHVKKLNAKQFAQKKGQSNFEGQIYREVDALIRENKELIANSQIDVTKNSAGYFLDGIVGDDGSIDLA